MLEGTKGYLRSVAAPPLPHKRHPTPECSRDSRHCKQPIPRFQPGWERTWGRRPSLFSRDMARVPRSLCPRSAFFLGYYQPMYDVIGAVCCCQSLFQAHAPSVRVALGTKLCTRAESHRGAVRPVEQVGERCSAADDGNGRADHVAKSVENKSWSFRRFASEPIA